jgi:hypothetical protein
MACRCSARPSVPSWRKWFLPRHSDRADRRPHAGLNPLGVQLTRNGVADAYTSNATNHIANMTRH